MKKLTLLFSILLIGVSFAFAQNVSTLTFSEENNNLPAVGSNFNVPINVSGFPVPTYIIYILVDYDKTVLNYTGKANDPNNWAKVTPTATGLQIQYDNFPAPMNIPNGKLLDLQFDFLGGNSPLNFGSNSRYLNNLFQTVYLTNITNGAVLGGFVDNVIVDGIWESALDWSLDVVPNAYHNVFVEGNASVSSVAVSNNLSVAVDGRLTINVGGSLSIGGNIFIDSDPSGTGSLVNHGTLNMLGSATVKQFMTGWIAWHLVSLPVNQVMSADVFMNCYLQYWDEPNSVWVDVQPDPDPSFSVLMDTPMKGYAAAYHGAADNMLEFSGLLNDGPYSIAVTNLGTSGNVNYDGWNLVGNPYPSALDVDAAGWTRVNVSHGVAYWDQTLNAGLGNYVYYGSGVPANGGSQFIPPMQGFFVKASGAGGMLGVTNTARAHTSQNFYKSEPANTLRLMVQSGNYNDETVVRFTEEATVNYDEQFDFFKLNAGNIPQIYSVTVNNETLAINTMPMIDENTVVNIGLTPGISGLMSLTASGLETIDNTFPVILVDHLANVNWNLRENPVYNFSANAGDASDRFSVHFRILTGISEAELAYVNIYSYDKQLYVDAGKSTGEVVVLNMLGQELVRTRLSEQLNVITLPVSNSYVVVKVISDQGISSRKVFIK